VLSAALPALWSGLAALALLWPAATFLQRWVESVGTDGDGDDDSEAEEIEEVRDGEGLFS
jgi:hypothetical protein